VTVELRDTATQTPDPVVFPAFALTSGERKKKMVVGIMFHGTHRDNVDAICRDGLHCYSYYTSSLYYAAGHARSARYDSKVQVLAMAVLVDTMADLKWKEKKLKEPFFSVPLFVVNVTL
jgi:hypothetical protein